MKIAVAGCCHGQLDVMYDIIDQEGKNPDIVLVCGDFEALRDEEDLRSMAAPAKYRVMGDFHKYFNGEKKAPYLTLFIGGNHESSRYLLEHQDGGWVAPNMYFIGYSGVVQFNGVRIGGLSGIFNNKSYTTLRTEKSPFDTSSVHSVNYVRQRDVQKLWLMGRDSIDIMLSHDWPAGIEQHGHLKKLLAKKPYLRNDITNNNFGSPPAMQLLVHLQPEIWCSAHIHIGFTAQYKHSDPNDLVPGARKTLFYATDKPYRPKTVVYLDFEAQNSNGLEPDEKWQKILKLDTLSPNSLTDV